MPRVRGYKMKSSFDNGFTLKEMQSIQEQDTRTGEDIYIPKNWYRLEDRFFYRCAFGAWPEKLSRNWDGEKVKQ